MSRKIEIAVALLFFVFCTGNVKAGIVTIDITAEIAEIDDPCGLLAGLGVGDTLTGSYVYDSATPDICHGGASRRQPLSRWLS